MGASNHKLLCMLALTAVFAGSAFASPLNSKLLSLVPPGAEIVAGFENQPALHGHGQLLLTTHNNRLDLDDWQALAGVDHKRVVQEVIEVAASPTGGGKLTEHLLLVAGRVDTERIFSAAHLNGAEKSEFEGQMVMLIPPFTREKTEMPETRWLIILDSRIAMLGTPLLVQGALRRYLSHADTDMPLLERLSQLPNDVGSWNVLVSPRRAPTDYTVAQPTSPWARLLQGAEVLMIGARFGSRVRIDLSFHARGESGQEFLTEKAESFAEVFASGPSDGRSPRPSQNRLGNLRLEPNHLEASIELSQAQFEQWGEQTTSLRITQPSTSRTAPRGE